MALVGVVHQAGAFMARLAEIMRWQEAPRFPHRHKTRISRKQREQMQAQFEDLHDHPMLSSLFAAERAVYQHACALAEKSPARHQGRGSPQDLREHPNPVAGDHPAGSRSSVLAHKGGAGGTDTLSCGASPKALGCISLPLLKNSARSMPQGSHAARLCVDADA